MDDTALPAHRTKHVGLLRYPFGSAVFDLEQLDDQATTTGSTLWLGAQCLSVYLASVLGKQPQLAAVDRPRLTALELGSGIGLTALALASLGYNVLATDVPPVLPLLRRNVERNLSSLPTTAGRVDVRELDWCALPDSWDWRAPWRITPSSNPVDTESGPTGLNAEPLSPPFDLIVTADTLYIPDLVDPLWRTLRAVLDVCAESEGRSPPVYVCFERRDPGLIDGALARARTKWGMTMERVSQTRMTKAMKKGGLNWDREEWAGVEVWKVTKSKSKHVSNHAATA